MADPTDWAAATQVVAGPAASEAAETAMAPTRTARGSVKSYLIGGVVGLVVGALVMLGLALGGLIGHGGAGA